MSAIADLFSAVENATLISFGKVFDAIFMLQWAEGDVTIWAVLAALFIFAIFL